MKPSIVGPRGDFSTKAKAGPNNRIELTALRAAAHAER
jgi:hypothetical protein